VLCTELAPSIVPEYGTCGECGEAPSMSPTQATDIPSSSPTGFLDGCAELPPSCSLNGNPDDEDRVIFCLAISGGIQVELCVLVEDVKNLLGRGTFFRVIVVTDRLYRC
jgi:hypothetical protein